MKKASQAPFQAREFARQAGVSVRTLHHYDQLGLLKPSDRTATGYRLYSRRDFARLQQIVTLKFIGFSLREIKKLLAGADLATALRLQRKTLEQRQHQLSQAVAAIAKAERMFAARRGPDWEAFAKVIEVIQMQTNNDWTKQYYNDEAQKLVAERQQLWSPELQQEVTEKWTVLLRDIEAAASTGIVPTSPAAQALAERHAKLIEAFTCGSQAITLGLKQMWSDVPNWPDAAKQQVFAPFAQRGVAAAQGSTPSLLSAKADAFLKKALQARQQSGGS
ncbi:MAG: MerR family transcriptional regulator [Verrucomicrobia bacterium]|nr:MerR family transcriptional regulator [Verrucomicrobiota bacterium]